MEYRNGNDSTNPLLVMDKLEAPEAFPYNILIKKVYGTGVPGSQIRIVYPDGSQRCITADRNASWVVYNEECEVELGDRITVYQTTPGYPESDGVTCRVMNMEPSLAPTAAPSVDPFHVNDTYIEGNGIPGAMILVERPGNPQFGGFVPYSSRWRVDAGSYNLRPGDRITVRQQDMMLQPSNPVSIIVQDNAEFIPVESINLNAGSLNMLSIGKTLRLEPTILPENATDKSITYTSNNPAVASVDQQGVITGLKTGTAIIRGTTHNGKVSTTSVRVTY